MSTHDSPSPSIAPSFLSGRAGVEPRAWVIALSSLAAAVAAYGQQWEFEPTVDLGVSYEDNIRLSSDQSESGFGASIRAAARGRRSDEVSELEFSAAFRQEEFPDHSDLNNSSAIVNAGWSYQMPRSEFQLDQSLSTQSTLTSEATTTGITDVNRQQFRFRIRPSWSSRLDEYSTLNLSASYEDVSYDDVEGTGLSNYHAGSVSVAAGRRLTERLVVSLASLYGRFEFRERRNNAENIVVQVGAEYDLSETFSVSAIAGLRQTESEFVDLFGRRITEESSGPAYSLSAQKQFGSGAALGALASRELRPSGGAEVLDTTRLRLRYSYPVDERLRVTLSSQAYRNRQVGELQRRGSRDFANARIGLSYQLRPSLSVTVDYRYRWQQYEDDASTVDSNRLSVSLAWRGR
jgi:predicted porin